MFVSEKQTLLMNEKRIISGGDMKNLLLRALTPIIFLVVTGVIISCGSGGGSTPPVDIPAPVAHLSVSTPDSDGHARVTGEAGAADAEVTVTIRNVTKEGPALVKEVVKMVETTVSASDGSFQDAIEADVGDTISVTRLVDGSEQSDSTAVPDDVIPFPTGSTLGDLVYNPTTNEVIVVGNDGTSLYLYTLDLDTNDVDTWTLTVAGTSFAGDTRIAIDDTNQIVTFFDTNDVGWVWDYDIALGAGNRTALGFAPADIATPPLTAGYAILANATTTPSLSYFDHVANSDAALGDVTDDAATVQASAEWIDIDADDTGDYAAVVSLMPDGTYLLSTHSITPATPATTQEANTTLTGMTNPGGMVFSIDGGAVLITDQDNDRVTSVTNVPTGEQTNITVGDGPRGVAVNSAEDTAYVVNSTGRTLSIINLATNAVTSRNLTGLGSTMVVTDATGGIDTIMVLNTGDNTVSLIDL